MKTIDRSREPLRQTDYDRDAVVENLTAQLTAAQSRIIYLESLLDRAEQRAADMEIFRQTTGKWDGLA